MFSIEGYFDESGDLNTDPSIFGVAGYFISSDAAEQMDQNWEIVLKKYNVPYFHMVDCASGNGVFKHLPDMDRAEMVKELISLIKKYTAEGFAFLAKADSYEPPNNEQLDPYSYCAAGCAKALGTFLQMNRLDANISYFFEAGHANKGRAYNHIAEKVKRPGDSLTFASKEQKRLLQAADLLAWQATKYAKDYSFARWTGKEPKRAPRKDFMSLMEHGHCFMYIDREKQLNIELWPMSRRSQETKILHAGHDGPIYYWREGEDSTPIFPVERSLAFGMGGAKFAYLAFNGFGDKVFALAFDEIRLFEAVGMFMQATGLFENSEIMPVISAEAISLKDHGGQKILSIKARGAAQIGIVLDEKSIPALKDIIAKLQN